MIASPRVIPIVFKGDPLADSIGSFAQKLALSQYWSDTMGEYGVGSLTAADLVTIDEVPPAQIKTGDIAAWLTGKLTDSTLPLGAPDPNVLYAIYYPSGTTIGDPLGKAYSKSCTDFGGYHIEVAVGAVTVGYAVLPRCDAGIDTLTIASSHEFAEWATDPFPISHPAYARMDDAHFSWEVVMRGAEIGDLCTFLEPGLAINPIDLGFAVQRIWSNRQSQAGHSPCVPSPRPYFQAIPNPTDDVTLEYSDFDATVTKRTVTKGVRIPRGGSVQVAIQMYQDDPGSVSQPTAYASGAAELAGGQQSQFEYALSASRAPAGQNIALTVTAPNGPAQEFATTLVAVSRSTYFVWPFVVQAD